MGADVITLPVIRVERRSDDDDARIVIPCAIEPKLHRALGRLADKHWRGDIKQCATDLLQTAIVSHASRRK